MRRGIRPRAAFLIRQRRRKLWRRRAWNAWTAWKEEFDQEFQDLDEIDLDNDEVEGRVQTEEGLNDGDFMDADFAMLEDIDLAALHTVFSDMQGDPDGFLADGRPRVDAVVARLHDMGLPGKVNRSDIDEAYDHWLSRQ